MKTNIVKRKESDDKACKQKNSKKYKKEKEKCHLAVNIKG